MATRAGPTQDEVPVPIESRTAAISTITSRVIQIVKSIRYAQARWDGPARGYRKVIRSGVTSRMVVSSGSSLRVVAAVAMVDRGSSPLPGAPRPGPRLERMLPEAPRPRNGQSGDQ